jgi:hypothetical protein
VNTFEQKLGKSNTAISVDEPQMKTASFNIIFVALPTLYILQFKGVRIFSGWEGGRGQIRTPD